MKKAKVKEIIDHAMDGEMMLWLPGSGAGIVGGYFKERRGRELLGRLGHKDGGWEDGPGGAVGGLRVAEAR